MKISGSQVSAKLVMRLQRLGPFSFMTGAVTMGLCGWTLVADFEAPGVRGVIPPFSGALPRAHALAFGAHVWACVAALAVDAGASSASVVSRATAARERVLPGECETTAVIQCSHRHSAPGALPLPGAFVRALLHPLEPRVRARAPADLGALPAVDQDHVGGEVVRATQQRGADAAGVDRSAERLEVAYAGC